MQPLHPPPRAGRCPVARRAADADADADAANRSGSRAALPSGILIAVSSRRP